MEGLGVKVVVQRELLAFANALPAEEEDMASDFADLEVGVAAVIDEFGAGSVNGAVDSPVLVQAKEGEVFRTSGATNLSQPHKRLPHVEPLAAIFDDFPARRNGFPCINTITVNPRAPDPQDVPGKLGIDRWNRIGSCAHSGHPPGGSGPAKATSAPRKNRDRD